MKESTKILHTKLSFEGAAPTVTPIFQNSAFLSTSPHFYSRKSNPNCNEVEEVIKQIENCSHAIAVNTGMAAINLVLKILKPGDHVLINELIYGCTYRYITDFCAHYNMTLDKVDFENEKGWLDKVTPKTRMLFFETPTNPLLKTINIKNISEKAKSKSKQALIVVDNTWATPFFQKPLNHGADICVVSASKYYAGHSDVMGGVVTTNSKELGDQLAAWRFYTGANLDPHAAWLIRRSLQTFPLRMKEHERKIKIMSSFLSEQPAVAKVYIPEIDGHQLTGYGCILFIELHDKYEPQVLTFMNSLKLFDRGTSMASVVSSVAQPYSGSHASMTEHEKSKVGIKKTLVRLCFGLEDEEDLVADISQALKALA
ncbi:MAG: aminotransferase class I/II-fold pyridoxal phosphate-dependent enzyme [Pseudomonadota bacterium]|nr:aminotransferase class I/II-fold pyridoxal phosphate-dependent enzyme [Pseudomonadota bacterium]